MKFKSEVQLEALNNATVDTDKFLVSDGGVVKYRTGTEVLSDLGIDPTVKAGVAINKGQAVYVITADGTNIIVGKASNLTEVSSSKTLGLLDATVPLNGMANVISNGLLEGLDTSTATVGDPVWLGENGNLIYGLANKPYAPKHLVYIGVVTRVNLNNGEIFINVQNGFELNEIHDVDLKTVIPVNGHVLGYNGTLWVNKTIAGWLGYTPANANGTTNYISKFTGSTALGNSLLYDNGTNVGIGTTSPAFKLQVKTPTLLIGSTYSWAFDLTRINDTQRGLSIGLGVSNEVVMGSHNSDMAFGHTFGTDTNGNPIFFETVRIQHVDQAVGKVGIGIPSPNEKLHVNGYTLSTGYKIPSGLSSWFLKADGTYDSGTYALDSNVVHKTGNESITGNKSFSNSTGNPAITVSNSNNGSQGIFSTNTSGGSGIYSGNSSSGTGITSSNGSTGNGIYSGNGGTGTGIFSYNGGTGIGIFLENITSGINAYLTNVGSGKNLVLNNTSTGTGMPFTIQKIGVDKLTISDTGYITSSDGAIFDSTVKALSYQLSGGTGNSLYYGHTNKLVLANYEIGGGIDFETNGGAINMVLGADASLSVVGAITGSNLSGTNTGDQTLTGLGGVPTSRTLTINGVTQDLSANRTFTVAGSMSIGGLITSATAGSVLFAGTGGVLQQDNSQFFWDDTNNRLGLGITIPAEKLDVSGNIKMSGGGGRTLTIEATGAGGTELRLLPNTTAGYARINVGNTSQPLDFQMNSANVMRITQAGNVGIGTTSPSAKLHLVGTTNLIRLQDDGAYQEFYNTANTTRNGYIQFNSASNARINVEIAQGLSVYTSSIERLTIGASGAAAFTGNLRVTGSFKDSNDLPGTSGQVLSSTGTGTSWITNGGLKGIHSIIKLSSGQSTFASISAIGLSTIVGGANRLTVYPYIPAQAITSASLYINVTTAVVGSNVQILIYSNLNGKPDSLLYQSTNLDCATTGIKTVTTTQTFAAGTTYWIGIHTSSNQTLSALNQAAVINIGVNAIVPFNSFYITPAFGTAPTSFGTPVGSLATNPPFIGITL